MALGAALLLAAALAGDTTYVRDAGGDGRFPLAADGRAATIYVSGSDWIGVRRAANDLRADVERVTSLAPRVVTDSAPNGSAVVLVGTIGKSALIDRLVAARKLDVRSVTGQWETFAMQVVERPMPNVARALVIAGSDKRGTIYGVYELSRRIGVSPWTWWADVPVPHRNGLYVSPRRLSLGTPAVKYRGIFINDEAPAFSGWTREKFVGVNHAAYEKIFELILRLRGNYLWPAMWGNAFADDDSLNAVRAEEYGVVMGTSHHEPLTRAQQEWKRYGSGPWDYTKNDSVLRAFWRTGIERMVAGQRENLVTVGMRGDGDEPMTQGTAISLLERIVRDQRAIIADVTTQPASETPQLWALYKEVQDYYDQGMQVPDDVTLLFADDNWGNIRRLPKPNDRGRAGGFGVYYHFDYVGGPRNYKWINTNPIARTWEQMHLAHERGANRIWIVNVGDIKPMEMPISFFLDYAWKPEAIPADSLPAWTRAWAAQQFGDRSASAIADVITTTLKYVGRRKPELLDTATYSLTNFGEAERVIADYRALRARAESLGTTLPAASRDAYYQLVLHPVLAAANLHELYVTVAQNRLYAQQGRASANALADRARALFDRDAELRAFWDDSLAGGKWRHLMDQTHIGYTYWQEPPRNVMPRVDVIQVPAAADMGVAIVEQNGGKTLPRFDPYARQTYHVDVFDRGRTPFEFTAEAGVPWVHVSPARGTVRDDQRVAISVDWTLAPNGATRVPITFHGPNGQRAVVTAVVSNVALPAGTSSPAFIESGGHVSIEAEHYAKAVSTDTARFVRVPDLGRTGSAMTTMPSTARRQTPGAPNAARLEYRVVLFDTGMVRVRTYLSPSLDFTGGDGLRYAVSIDDEAPQIVNMHADGSSNGKAEGNRAWERMVSDESKIVESRHHVATPGAHVLKVWMVDPGVVVQKLVLSTGEVPNSYLGPPESPFWPEVKR